MFRRVFSLIGLLACLTVPAFAAERSAAVDARPSVSDQLIADRIGEQIGRYVFYTIFDDVQGRVDDGLVTLTGKVTAPYKAKEIAALARRISGVREVVNAIE